MPKRGLNSGPGRMAVVLNAAKDLVVDSGFFAAFSMTASRASQNHARSFGEARSAIACRRIAATVIMSSDILP